MNLRFARGMREYVDIDYWYKLNSAQIEWLKAFLEDEYNARPRKDAPKGDRVRSYRKKYLAKNDLFSNWARTEMSEIIESEIFHQTKRIRRPKIAMPIMSTNLNSLNSERSEHGKSETKQE
jgi:hypothetical protein